MICASNTNITFIYFRLSLVFTGRLVSISFNCSKYVLTLNKRKDEKDNVSAIHELYLHEKTNCAYYFTSP